MNDTQLHRIDHRALDSAILLLLWLSPLCVTSAVAQSLPPGWAVSDVGSPVIPGFAINSNETFTVSGAGSGIVGDLDQFTIAYRRLTGDGTIVARVGTLPLTPTTAQAGVMFRQGLTGSSAHGSVLVSRSDGITFTRRRSAGAATSSTAAGGGSAPVWVRVDRRSSTVTASYSTDGSTWTLLGVDTVAMNNALYVGLAVSSRLQVAAVQATFTGVTVTPLVEYGGPLPSGWSSQDLGGPGQAGAAAYDAGTFGLVGGGSDVGGTWDQFRYAYGQVTTEVDVVARVRDLGNTNAQSKAGIMIRDSLTPNGAHASLFVTASGATLFRRRPAGGQATIDTAGASNQAPVWFKLSLRNGVASGYQSMDGVSWTLVGTQALTLPSTYYAGLAVTSRDNAATVTTNIDNVQVTAAANAAPTVSLTAPANGSTYSAPATIMVGADASDTDGMIARVDFYQGTTLLGSDTTSPYSFTWSGAPAGTYSLTARATDDDGATATSAARTVTVNPPANQPPSAALTAPANGATFTAPATITINATAADTDGTIARVDFYSGTTLVGSDTTSPYSFTWNNVPTGTYSLTARATDDDGATTTSAASTVTVNSTSTQRSAVFNPSPDHDSLVNSYLLEIFAAAADPSTATPIATQNLGKPAVVNGDCTADITSTINALAPGNYRATVAAVGNGGSPRSGPADFTR